MSLVAILRVIAFYILAVLVATLLGGLIQAQINLADLAEAPASLAERLAATWAILPDVLPTFAAMVAAALVITLPIAEVLSRIFRPWRWLLFALAGAGGIWAAYKVQETVLAMPNITAPGAGWQWLAVCVAVAIGSCLFGYLTRPKAKRGLRVLG